MASSFSNCSRVPGARGSNLIVLVLTVLLLAPSEAQAQHLSSRSAVWAGTGAALLGAALLDSRLRSELAGGEQARFEDFSKVGNALGRPGFVVPIMGIVYGGGRLVGERRLASATVHSLVALTAAGVVNGAVKSGLGRRRPGADNDAGSFRPLSLADQWQSFPSGHAVVAFSLATAISEEAQEPLVSVLSYGAAALVGWSRVYEDRHWASDVVGGAIIGTVASRLTLRWLHARASYEGERHGIGSDVRLALLPGGVAIAIFPPGGPVASR